MSGSAARRFGFGEDSGNVKGFYATLTDAVNDIAAHGFDSAARVQQWAELIREAAERDMIPEAVLQARLQDVLRTAYGRLVDRQGILRQHPGIGSLTLAQVAPRLRAELDRRVLASADLIKLNRKNAIERTVQRFAGWASSVPLAGDDNLDKREAKDTIRKSLAQLPFTERRVMIDQGHKFTATLSGILANAGGAVAAIWHSHWRQVGYNYREDHKERDGKLYLIRNSWGIQRGLINVGGQTYLDEITQPAQEPFCRCWAEYVYGLDKLPRETLTRKGRIALDRASGSVLGRLPEVVPG